MQEIQRLGACLFLFYVLAGTTAAIAVPIAQMMDGSTANSWIFELPADGNLFFDSLVVPEGVRVSFEGGASGIVLTAQERIWIDGALNAGPRSLTLNAPSISFGPNYFITGGGTDFNINTISFDGGPNFNPRGSILLNGERIVTSTPFPGETFGVVLTQIFREPLAPFEIQNTVIEFVSLPDGILQSVPEPASLVLVCTVLVLASARIRARIFSSVGILRKSASFAPIARRALSFLADKAAYKVS